MPEVGSGEAGTALATAGVVPATSVGSAAVGGNSVCTGGCVPAPSGTTLAVAEPAASAALGDTSIAGCVERDTVVGLIRSGCPQPVNTSNTRRIQ